MKKYPTGILCLLGFAGLALGVLYWVSAPYREELRQSRGSKMYRDRLADELLAATEVHVVEHSWFHDRRNEDGEPDDEFGLTEYARIKLDADQTRELARIAGRCDPSPASFLSLGIFEPHHSVILHGPGGEESRVLVAFSPGCVQWSDVTQGDWPDMVDAIHPEGLAGALETWISSLGFRVSADWGQIAEQETGGKRAVGPPHSLRPGAVDSVPPEH